MSTINSLIQKVKLLDEKLAEDLFSALKRANLASSTELRKEIEFLLVHKLISRREALRRMSPSLSEEEISQLLLEQSLEDPSLYVPSVPFIWTTQGSSDISILQTSSSSSDTFTLTHPTLNSDSTKK